MTNTSITEGAFETVLFDSLVTDGYEVIARDRFDRERAIFPEMVLAFIRATQPKQWEKLEALHGAKTGERIIHDLCNWMDTHGSLATLPSRGFGRATPMDLETQPRESAHHT